MKRSVLLYQPDSYRTQLLAEFVTLFMAVPLFVAFLLPAEGFYPALFLFTGLGLALLHITPGFAWAELWRGWSNWRSIELVAASLVVLVGCLAVIHLVRPESAFYLLKQRPDLLLVLLLSYPVLSVLPQELMFRPLFYRRYHYILPTGWRADVLNAAVFSFAHLMYWSWIVAVMTFLGGLVFARAYRARGSFALAVLLHSLAGNIIFIVGLGAFFLVVNAERPF
ncbi:type II CAAX prenyl endopeptidase Rce1 family protein [Lutimaribacter marinistellae]|uniref:Type II CAAX prenyl endopeptidase Rce1 family protein n=1 Tax=Lutimaribacter marinistellae TaxID=1820329 RepID=A0ABV7TFH1_9RHOB